MPPIKWYDIFTAEPGDECTRVGLYDDVGTGTQSANDFVNAFNAIKTPKIELHINSDGGAILDGFACYNAIKNHPAEVTTHIDGVAASIASLIALAGNKVVMAKNAFMMIHSGWAKAAGDPTELRKQADVLDKLNGSIAAAYAEKSGKKPEDIRAAMDAETWFDSAEAKAYGLVDEVEGDGDEKRMASAALLAVAKYQKTPPALRAFAASAARNVPQPQAKGQKMEKLMCKDGKWYLGEVEVDASAALATAQPAASIAEAQAKARDEGMKAERDYRNMFNTTVGAAGLDAAGATEFEKQFYGRSETDLKFLASHAIGKRARALGEEAPGNGEGEQKTDAAKAEAIVGKAAAERFNSERQVRQMFGILGSVSATDPSYQAAMNRYVASAQKQAKDEAAQTASATAAK